MEYSLVVAVLTAIATLLVVLAPFFIGKGGTLAAASAVQSKDQLQQIKRALAKRYLIDEQAFENKEISMRAWNARREFLLRRYIDTARRLDYLEYIERAGSGAV
jgi:hypothetical protein